MISYYIYMAFFTKFVVLQNFVICGLTSKKMKFVCVWEQPHKITQSYVLKCIMICNWSSDFIFFRKLLILKDFLGYTINLFEPTSGVCNILFEIISSKRAPMLTHIFA